MTKGDELIATMANCDGLQAKENTRKGKSELEVTVEAMSTLQGGLPNQTTFTGWSSRSGSGSDSSPRSLPSSEATVNLAAPDFPEQDVQKDYDLPDQLAGGGQEDLPDQHVSEHHDFQEGHVGDHSAPLTSFDLGDPSTSGHISSAIEPPAPLEGVRAPPEGVLSDPNLDGLPSTPRLFLRKSRRSHSVWVLSDPNLDGLPSTPRLFIRKSRRSQSVWEILSEF